MSIIPTTDPVTEMLTSSTLEIVRASHAVACAFKNQNDQLNALPMSDYLALINEVPETTAMRFAMRDAFAAVINSSLDAICAEKPQYAAQFSTRIPTGCWRAGVSLVEGVYVETPVEPPVEL